MISMLREPYTSLRYVAERIDMAKLYHIKLPEDIEEWSPFLIAQEYALKRGYLYEKSGNSDNYRAGLEMLTDIFLGKVVF